MNYQDYMQRALDLAKLGQGRTSPNPMVGAVVVHNNKIIGEGWHKKAGQAHAEVEAIASVKNTSLLANSTIFVTLEPCSHFGKTPPCSDLIIKHKIPKVVIACTDPNPLVAGKGIQKLKKAGIEVIEHILEKQALDLNKRFFKFHNSKRPYVVLKWAQSADGFLDPRTAAKKGQKAVSGPVAKVLTHKWRSQEEGILVGYKTAQIDNPLLDARLWGGKNPIRMVFDKSNNLDTSAHILNYKGVSIVFNKDVDSVENHITKVKVNLKNWWNDVLNYCYENNIQSVFVEGGEKTLSHVLNSEQYDEVRVYQSQENFNIGLKSPQISGLPKYIQNIGEDKLHLFLK